MDKDEFVIGLSRAESAFAEAVKCFYSAIFLDNYNSEAARRQIDRGIEHVDHGLQVISHFRVQGGTA